MIIISDDSKPLDVAPRQQTFSPACQGEETNLQTRVLLWLCGLYVPGASTKAEAAWNWELEVHVQSLGSAVPNVQRSE